MRVLYLCSDLGIPVLGRKGASVHVRGLIAALVREGHRVVLAAPVGTRTPWEEPARLDAPWLHLPPGPETVRATLALKAFQETLLDEGEDTGSLTGEVRRILYDQELRDELVHRFEKSPPDFIYERASLYSTAGVLASRALGRPLLLEMNAPLALEQKTYRGTGLGELAARAERFAVTSAGAVLAVSAALGDYVASLSVPKERIHVVPNGVDASLFHPAERDPGVRARLGLPSGPLVGFVGGLRAWHGVEVLPALLARLKERHPDVSLVVAGDGPLRARLMTDLAGRGLSSAAVFTGALSHEEIPAFVRELDVALAPYPKVAHAFYFSPLKLVEYMACGVAVVAAACGQIEEMVTDGETGLLYPPGDESALFAATDQALSDAPLRHRLGAAAARSVGDRYTWDQNARRVAGIARGLIARDAG